MNTYQIVAKEKDAFYNRICSYLAGIGVRRVTHRQDADFSVVLGGDGTFIGASRTGIQSPVVVINTGTLGFLTSSTKDLALDTIDRVLLGDFTVTTRHLLTAKVEWVLDCKEHCAVNEFVLRSYEGLVHIAVYSQDTDNSPEVQVANYRADGLIFATPTGSTAYSLSATGPIIHPGCNSIVVTPICPNGLTQRPLVLPASARLRVVPQHDVVFIIDGQVKHKMEKGTTVRIEYGDESIQTVNPMNDYYGVLQEKLSWGRNGIDTK